MNSDNGHAGPPGESHPLQELPATTPQHVTFEAPSTSFRASKISMNGLGVIQRLRNKSGSTSGEA